MPEATQTAPAGETQPLVHCVKWRKRDQSEPAAQVVLHDRITIENAAELRTALRNALEEKPADLSVDLSGVSYIDTAGVATLVEAAKVARRQGARLILAGLRDQPRDLLKVTHLDHLFDIAATEADK